MSKPTPGTKIHVEFDGTVVSKECAAENIGALVPTYDEGFTPVLDSQGAIHLIWHEEYGDTTVYSRTQPEGWPVQIGDIWDVDGAEYFVKESLRFSGQVFVCAVSKGGPSYPDDQLEMFKACNPTLIRRRDGSF